MWNQFICFVLFIRYYTKQCSTSLKVTDRSQYDTFRYTQDKILSTTIYCKCENRLSPARARQYASNLLSINKPHGKKARRFISIFHRILNLCPMNNISLNSTIDFEQAPILPVILNAIIQGWNFHFLYQITRFRMFINKWN